MTQQSITGFEGHSYYQRSSCGINCHIRVSDGFTPYMCYGSSSGPQQCTKRRPPSSIAPSG